MYSLILAIVDIFFSVKGSIEWVSCDRIEYPFMIGGSSLLTNLFVGLVCNLSLLSFRVKLKFWYSSTWSGIGRFMSFAINLCFPPYVLCKFWKKRLDAL